MGEVSYSGSECDGVGQDANGNAVAFIAADWLHLAAAPTFALMALLVVFVGDGSPEMLLCSVARMSPLSGMAVMYLLMSVFHSAAWLRLIADRRCKRRRCPDKECNTRQPSMAQF